MTYKTAAYFLSVFFFIANLQVSYALNEENSNIEETLYAGMDYKKVFDQSKILTHFSNTNNTSTELDKALIADYLTKKTSAMGRALYAPIFSTGLPLLITSLCLYLAKNDTLTGLLQFTLIAYVSNMVQQLFKVGYCFLTPPSDPLAPYEKFYAERKRFLSPTLQNTLEDKFSTARKTPMSIGSTLMFANIALNLPLSSKQLRMPSQEELNNLLSGYNPTLDQKLISKLFHHYKRISSTMEPLKTPKSILYLQGPPGTGKTYVTHQLATLMDAPLVELKASDNPSMIIGTENSPGSLLEAITKPNMMRNAIIFIDEADRIINKEGASLQLFLPLLEPDATYFYSPYLRTNIDISHLCFVLAGNTEIKDSALKSRLAVIEFKGMTKEFKQSIVTEMVKQAQSTKLLKSLDGTLSQSINVLIDKEPNIRQLRLEVSDLIDQHEFKTA